ncbi:hypothetical protein N7490_008777 [Penicillium lividum]|nr:hypothetical protein N7490_008777 [Penicillium lividum]
MHVVRRLLGMALVLGSAPAHYAWPSRSGQANQPTGYIWSQIGHQSSTDCLGFLEQSELMSAREDTSRLTITSDDGSRQRKGGRMRAISNQQGLEEGVDPS